MPYRAILMPFRASLPEMIRFLSLPPAENQSRLANLTPLPLVLATTLSFPVFSFQAAIGQWSVIGGQQNLVAIRGFPHALLIDPFRGLRLAPKLFAWFHALKPK